jgi:hypothetical protein
VEKNLNTIQDPLRADMGNEVKCTKTPHHEINVAAADSAASWRGITIKIKVPRYFVWAWLEQKILWNPILLSGMRIHSSCIPIS